MFFQKKTFIYAFDTTLIFEKDNNQNNIRLKFNDVFTFI